MFPSYEDHPVLQGLFCSFSVTSKTPKQRATVGTEYPMTDEVKSREYVGDHTQEVHYEYAIILNMLGGSGPPIVGALT